MALDFGSGGTFSVKMEGPFGSSGTAIKLTSFTAAAADWKGAVSPYSQVVQVEGISMASKVDIQLSVEQMQIFHDQVIAFTTVNTDGVVTLYAVGDKPAFDCTFQATLTNVDAGENTTIVGNTVSTTQAQADYAQDDEKNAGYIRNKPNYAIEKAQKTADDVAKSALYKSGGTMTGALNMGSNKLSGLVEPVVETDAVPKGFMERYVSGKRKTVTVTLATAGWKDSLQTVSVDGVTADETKTDVIASPKAADYEAYSEAGILLFSQSDGGITFKCSDVPKVDIHVSVMVFM
jgi:hypothetical protein